MKPHCVMAIISAPPTHQNLSHNSTVGLIILEKGTEISSKDWVKKNWTVPRIENRITFPILLQSSWFSSKIKYSWDGYFDQVSNWLGKNCEFFT